MACPPWPLPTALCLIAACLLGAQDARALTLRPVEDPQAVLHNPDMGWVVYENYPIDQGSGATLSLVPEPDWAGVDHVAIMFSWADVEREPGVYDFEKVDYAYDWWRQRGKAIQLRLSAESLLWWNPRGAGLGVPRHVLDRLPAASVQVRQCEGLDYTVVDAREPYYLERLAAFLRAVAAHYAPEGKRAVNLVDLRGFGLWGEWHTGFAYPSLEARRETLVGILDCWSEALPEHRLALSYSYDPDSPPELRGGPTDRFDPAWATTYRDYLRFGAFDHALTLPNITFRRDGAGGAVHSNERRLCEEAWRGLRGPMVCEFLGGYAANLKGGLDWVRWMVSDALSLHPNYVCLLGWQCQDAHDFLTGQPELVAEGLRRMGYRLVPTRVRCPGRLVAGQKVRLAMDWENRGEGRALADYELQLRLTDTGGRAVAEASAGSLPTSRWLKGRSYRVSTTVVFGATPGEAWKLWLRVVDPRDGRTIALPLRTGSAEGWYPLDGGAGA